MPAFLSGKCGLSVACCCERVDPESALLHVRTNKVNLELDIGLRFEFDIAHLKDISGKKFNLHLIFKLFEFYLQFI